MLRPLRAFAQYDRLSKAPFVIFLEPPAIDRRILNQHSLFSLMSSPTARLDDWVRGHAELFRRGLAPLAGAAQSANVYQDFADGYFSILISGPWNLGELERRLPRLADAWATAPLPTWPAPCTRSPAWTTLT